MASFLYARAPMTTPPLDLQALMQAMEASVSGPSGPRFTPLPEGTFPAASLMAWMELVAAAEVPAVPAEMVTSLPLDALLNSEDRDYPGVQDTLEQLQRANATLEEGVMLRWDCCAGFSVKVGMSEGMAPPMAERALEPIEPRTMDLLYDFPAEHVAVLRRPWVDAQAVDGFPLEFRVFVEDGQAVAVANYYVQRPLADTPENRQAARTALGLSRRILAALRERGTVPAMPRQPEPERVAATLDFLVTLAGDVVFLEAGPGHFFGAHPCAFLQPDGTVAPLAGLALASGAPALPLADLETP